MKATTRTPVKESTFTLIALLFLVVMVMFLTSFSFAEARNTRMQLQAIGQMLQAQQANQAPAQAE